MVQAAPHPLRALRLKASSALLCAVHLSLGALAAPKVKGPDGLPPRPDFKFATELTADVYDEHVTRVANETQAGLAPPYFPMVMFHVSWCKHCRHALPEFEEAAGMIDAAAKQGQLKHLPATPRFFLVECDSTPGTKKLCSKHTDTTYPLIILFRENHAIRFNRPRTAQVFAWWSTHAARPMVSEVRNDQHLQSFGEHATVFILKADPVKQRGILDDWAQVAFDFLENYHFTIALPDSELGKQLPPAPTVTVRGPGMDPLPLEGDISYRTLGAWANFNRFMPVEKLTVWIGHDLMSSAVPVVTLAFDGASSAGVAMRETFKKVALGMRPAGEFLFAVANMSDKDTAEYIGNAFPLVAAPQIFVFSGRDLYWEDPTFTAPALLTAERVRELMSSTEARQEATVASWAKAKRKLAVRMGTGSLAGALAVVGAPLMVLACCWACCRELMRPDEEAEMFEAKKEK